MKKNIDRFKLVCSSLLLEGQLYEDLDLSDKGELIEVVLCNRVDLEKYPEVREVLQLLSKSRYELLNTIVIVE